MMVLVLLLKKHHKFRNCKVKIYKRHSIIINNITMKLIKTQTNMIY